VLTPVHEFCDIMLLCMCVCRAVVLHEDKKYYPSAEEVYGPGVESLVSLWVWMWVWVWVWAWGGVSGEFVGVDVGMGVGVNGCPKCLLRVPVHVFLLGLLFSNYACARCTSLKLVRLSSCKQNPAISPAKSRMWGGQTSSFVLNLVQACGVQACGVSFIFFCPLSCTSNASITHIASGRIMLSP